MNLREWALVQGVHPVTAYRWLREGRLPVPAGRVGWLILVEAPIVVEAVRVVVYCRVSSAGQKDDLERRAGRVVSGATGRGFAVERVVSEIGSGMTGRRRKLIRILSDPTVSVLVVEYRDRLTRFGFDHLAAGLAVSGRQIVVLDEAETVDDLVRDVTEVLTSLCAGLCGRRSGSRRAAKAVAVASGVLEASP